MTDIKIKSFFGEAWRIYKENWGIIIGAGFIFILVNIAIQFLLGFVDVFPVLISPAVVIIAMIFLTIIEMGTVKFFLNLADKKQAQIKDLFTGVSSFKHILKFIIVGILVGLFTFSGFLAFIIPGIILGLAFAFQQFAAYENTMGIEDTIVYTSSLTRGYRWKIFFFMILMGLTVIAGILALGIGLIIALPLIQIASALFYRKLQSIKGTTLAEVVEYHAQVKQTKKEA